jgi:hypothetical protein
MHVKETQSREPIIAWDENFLSTENRGNQRGGDESLAGKRGNISSGIRQDFLETEFGFKRRDGA